jgi:hypothetical protein
MASRPSAAANRSFSVKATVNIFEKNTAVTPSAKKNVVVSKDRRKPAVNWSKDKSTQPLESAEAKKEPKYPAGKFKRDATLVQVNLDCEEVCNGDRTAQKCDGNVNGQRKQRTAEFLTNISEEEHENFLVKNDRDLKSYSDQAKSGPNATVFTVTEGSERSKSEHNQTKIKPVVPIKKVTKQQINTSVPFTKHYSSDSHCVKESYNSEEEHEKFSVKNDRGLISYSDQAKSGPNATVFTVTESSERSKSEHNQTKTKPVVPIKKVTKHQINTSVPFSKNNSSDSNCIKEIWKPGNICDTKRTMGMDENTSVRHHKFEFPQNSSAMSESSVKKLHTTQDREKLQDGDKEPVVPIRSYLWGPSVPRTNQFMSVPGTNHSTSTAVSNRTTSLPGTNQMTSVPGSNQPTSVPFTVKKHYASENPDNCASRNIYSMDDLYDDVFPPSTVCSRGISSNPTYSVGPPPDDDTYNDVFPSINDVKLCARSATSEGTFR